MLRTILFLGAYPSSFDWSHSSLKKKGKIIYPDSFARIYLSQFTLSETNELADQIAVLSVYGPRYRRFSSTFRDGVYESTKRRSRVRFRWKWSGGNICILEAYRSSRNLSPRQ